MWTAVKGDVAMIRSKLIKKVHMECPLCDHVHDVEERMRIASTIIKGEEVDYEETYYFCRNCDDDENEFVTGKMENENLLNARNAYRVMHNLLTSSEIVDIREQYGLSQADMAKLLGWGEATISRYESKAIQDEAYDNILRIVKDNPLVALDFLQKNKDKFSSLKAMGIKQRIISNLNRDGKEYLQRKALESEYANYQEPCDANGNCLLNIEKLEAIVSYYAKRVSNLYKVKLMKMLWYTDAISFRENNASMTGLVYLHEAMGALPVGHYKIMGLENVRVQEEEGFDYTKYHVLPNELLDENALSDAEKEILDAVVGKFNSYTAQEIVEYMHKEVAYLETNDFDVIPFSVAKNIRSF